ncbi:MAG: hypothetical protein HY644_08295 [Acidobacteria bacterium]|nr:hypothetical protein [Acidobacteriota bacterium]
MQVIANQNITGTVIQMDGHHFENCAVTNSVLVYGGGDFSWTNCQFANCQIRLIGPAQRAIQFLQFFGVVPQQVPPKAEAAGSSQLQ